MDVVGAGWPHAAPAVTDAPARPALALLRCPRCGGSLIPEDATRISCDGCGFGVAVAGGIIDFVAGLAATRLDDIDYDAVYPVNQANAAQQYKTIRASTGPLWPDDLGDAVEIGAGTGGFTMAVLRQASARHVVITDISPKMLRQCSTRLSGFTDLRCESLTFATYSTTEDCFRAQAFDTCFGTAVLHHLTDVDAFLRRTHDLLKPGGRAFFTEPNLRFHAALTATLGGILADWIDARETLDDAFHRMANWLSEVHCNIANNGDLEVLAEREDKHVFVAEAIEAAGAAAGFGVTLALPGGPDPTGLNTILTYLGQCNTGPANLQRVREAWTGRHFAHLTPRDQSPTYVLWLEKCGRPVAGNVAVKAAPWPDVVLGPDAVPARPTRLSLTFVLSRCDQGLLLSVKGWCLASYRIKSLRVGALGTFRKLPVWRPRPDVQAAFNRGRRYPPVHALCSGVDGTVVLPEAADDSPVRVIFDVLMVDGRRIAGRGVRLVPDGPGRVVQTEDLGGPLDDNLSAAVILARGLSTPEAG